MKKINILRRLARVADKLDDLKYHKESSLVTSIMFRVAQHSELGWDYPAGAEHDPHAPWNSEDKAYDKAMEIVDNRIEFNFIPDVHQCIQSLLKIAEYTNGNIKDIFHKNLDPNDPVRQELYRILSSFKKNTEAIFGEHFGANIAIEVIKRVSENNSTDIKQLVHEALEQFLDDIYEEETEKLNRNSGELY